MPDSQVTGTARTCTSCAQPSCAGVQECPECGESVHDDSTIARRGMCHECLVGVDGDGDEGGVGLRDEAEQTMIEASFHEDWFGEDLP